MELKDLTDIQKEELKQKLISLSDVEYTEIQILLEALKESLNNIKEVYGLTPKLGRKLIKTRYDDSLNSAVEEFEEFEEFMGLLK